MTTRTLADSDQSCPGTSSGLAEVSESASHVWPNVFRGNEVVWHSTTHNWRLDVDNIILGEELQCSFTMRAQNCSFSVGLGTQSHYVEVGHHLLSTTESSQPNFGLRAHVLVHQCSQLVFQRPCHLITQKVRPATTADADSDDEQCPDPEIPPAFTSVELALVNDTYENDLWAWFQKAFLKNFKNAVGKFFFVGLGKFLLRVHPAHIKKQFMSSCSTNPQGDAQPGNMEILITDKPRDLRQSKTPEKLCQRSVADYVLYDGRNKMYSIVGELKSVESEAEAQNVEQLIGLFRKNQQAMLGFTCNPRAIIPRILLHRQGKLELLTLQPLSLDEQSYLHSLQRLATLFIAFISIVNIAL